MTAPAKFSMSSKVPIHDVKTKKLRVMPDERGWLMEVLRADETELFTKFGQAYVSATYPGVVKAWHYHKKQVDHFACVTGMIKLVFDRPTRRLIGAHCVGDSATELVHVGQAMIELKGTVETIIAMVFNYPTLSEAYKYAAYDALGRWDKEPPRAPTEGGGA